MDAELSNAYARYRADPTAERRQELEAACVPVAHRAAVLMHRRLPAHVGLDVEDLQNDAWPAVAKAIDTYQDDKGSSLRTWLYLRATGAMLDALRRLDWVPRLERQREKAGEVLPVRIHSTDWTRAYTDKTVSHEPAAPTGWKRDIDFWRDTLRPVRNKRERLLLLLYYEEGLTMRDIGQHIGCSESRVSQMHTQLIERLQLYHGCREADPLAEVPPIPDPVQPDPPAVEWFAADAPDPPDTHPATIPFVPRPIPPVHGSRMSLPELIDQIDNLKVEDIDAELQQAIARVERLQRLRTLIAGPPPKKERTKRSQIAAQTVDPASVAVTDAGLSREQRVRAFLKAYGPAPAALIAEHTDIPKGSIHAVLNGCTGVNKSDTGVWQLGAA